MARKRHTAEQIIQKLRVVEVALSKGQSAGEACKKIGVTEPTYDR
jgi:putative transposase